MKPTYSGRKEKQAIEWANPTNKALRGFNSDRRKPLSSKRCKAFLTDLIKDQKPVRDESDGLCEVCYSTQADSIFMPCGHGGVCYDCAVDIFSKGNYSCHLCRKPILQVLQIDLEAHDFQNFPRVVSTTVEQQPALPSEPDCRSSASEQ